MAGNPSTLFFRLPQTTSGKRYPPLQRSSGKLSPSESASFRIFSTFAFVDGFQAFATKNNRENQKQKRPHNFSLLSSCWKKSCNHVIWQTCADIGFIQGFTSYPVPMIFQFFQGGIWTRCLYPWLPATSTLERALARAKGEIPLSLALQPTTSRPLRLSGCEF